MGSDAKKTNENKITYIKEVTAKKDDNLKYYFNQELDVARMFAEISEETEKEIPQLIFEELSINLAYKNDTILQNTNKVETVKCGKNVTFEKKTGLYKASADGYVHYHGEVVEVFPVVYIVDEKWKGMIVLPPQQGVENPILVDKIQATIVEMPIKLMIDYDVINDLVYKSINNDLGGVVTFVEGRKPIHGRARKLVIDYDFSTTAGKETSDGKMDFKDRKYVNNVDANEIIAHYEEDILPIDGHSIYNEAIKANYDTDTGYKLGKNVSIANDNIRLISNINGIISNADNTISVNNVIEIETVDLSTGNLEVLGSVIIHEDIADGFSVRAKGDIVVYGNVENAVLEAEGNVIISGSIVGGRVDINGNLYASFITQADITCHGDVIVSKYILKSSINSNNRVICLSQKEKGAIIGGTISAKNGVYAKTLGGNTGAHTDIYVGRDINLNKEYHNIVETIKDHKEKIKLIKNTLGADYLRNPRQFLMKLPPNKLEGVKKMLSEFNVLLQETNKLESDRLSIQHKIEQLIGATVTVTESVFPGTFINIGPVKKEIERNMKGVDFYFARDYHIILEKPPTTLDPKEYHVEIEKKPPKKKSNVDTKTGVFGVNKKK